MLERFKKYFPSTSAAIGGIGERTEDISPPRRMDIKFPSTRAGISGIGKRTEREELEKPILKFPETAAGTKIPFEFKFPKIDIPKEAKKEFFKKKFPSTTSAVIGKGESLSERIKGRVREFLGTKPPQRKLVAAEPVVPGREGPELGAIPFIKASADFIKYWDRRQQRQYHPGWRIFDFFPELFMMTPTKYRIIGASPNFPEISGFYKNEGTLINPNFVWHPGLKGGNFVSWSHKADKALKTMDNEDLVKLKEDRLKYWKGKMATEKGYWKDRARWNYYNIKKRALKNYYQSTEEEQSEWKSEWKKFKWSGGYPRSLWSVITIPPAYQ